MDEKSILTSVKAALGITEEYDVFDGQLIMFINSVFTILHQLGIGPEEEFSISDETSKWSDFIPDGQLQLVQAYMYLKVRLLFDPPSSSFVLESLNKQAQEYEWRMNVKAETTV